ncbi:NAD(P)H-binding protein [Kitasatospora sp. YST-16]|uniref:NmrA family NAD(P)-binding protein n=1 Tax=unclassified Kitasatospora TaxID=2633591 RepID=UPI0004C347A7|nr:MULTISPECIES: NmrA family NAD(P)-binding protein [unclassified Kitasatospora]WAL74494.1 NAD(P)H-binding protein [Kitasatospora sp. YST-16]WNW40558.1 NAD(P)H-binding protein [Streptomyces sp. Li-HN-5-13]
MIVVTGATGTVGSAVVAGLRERGVPVRALVRNADAVPAGWDAGVEAVVADFADPASLDAALTGAGAVYLLVAAQSAMAEHERNVIDAAVRTGGRPRVVLHTAAGAEGGATGARFVDAHVAGFAHLRASGLPWTVLAPNGFFQNFLGMAAPVRTGLLAVPGGSGAVSYVDARDVAAAAVAALVEDGHQGAVYTLTGPEALTHDALAEILAGAAGHPVRYVSPSPEQALEALVGAGYPRWNAEGLVELYAHYAAGRAATVSSDVEKLTGRPPRPFAAFAAEFATAFTAPPA